MLCPCLVDCVHVEVLPTEAPVCLGWEKMTALGPQSLSLRLWGDTACSLLH